MKHKGHGSTEVFCDEGLFGMIVLSQDFTTLAMAGLGFEVVALSARRHPIDQTI